MSQVEMSGEQVAAYTMPVLHHSRPVYAAWALKGGVSVELRAAFV